MGGDLIQRYLSGVLTIDQIETLTNKTMDGDLNTFENIDQASLKQITNKAKLPNDVVYATAPYIQTVAMHSDVFIDGLMNDQILKYDSTLSKWKNVTPAAAGVGDITNAANLTGTGATIFSGKVGTILNFNLLRSMSTPLSISNSGNEIQFTLANATSVVAGVVQLADNNESTGTKALAANDSRLTNARSPTTHNTSHQAGGTDIIKLDDLGQPDDNTDLDATIDRHGLVPKLPNNTTTFYRGDGTFASPSGSGTVRVYTREGNNQSVNSTGSKTTIYQFTILANDMGTVGVMEVELFFDYLNNTGSDQNMDIYIELGGVILWQDNMGTFTSSASRRTMNLSFKILMNNANNSQELWGDIRIGDTTAPDVGMGTSDDDEIATDSPISGASTVNMTSNQTLVIAVDHSTSSANLELRRRGAYAKIM